VCVLSYAGGIGYRYGLVLAGERRLWKMYKMYKNNNGRSDKKVINDQWVGVLG
jgi:hypothetical protein